MKRRMEARGSALVSVILVLLVLTIVGVGIAYFTSMEDRLSGNTRISKAGFYAADAGLRRGEALLTEVINLDATACGPQTLSALLAARTPLSNLKVPGGGYDALVMDLSTIANAGCLGADRKAYKDVPIPPPATVSVVDRVTYSLYLRNNVDDTSGTDTVDLDNIVNLISVGTVQLAAGVVVTKIVEEQLLLTTGGGSTGGQKDVNAGGTNTITGKS
ncbi:MAG: PilX N-terminal domain-containing pilus assembly protein [Acidobacteriota bacterium]